VGRLQYRQIEGGVVEDERVGWMAGQERRHVLGQDEPPLPPVEGRPQDEDGDAVGAILVDLLGLSIQREAAGYDATKGGLPQAERVLTGPEGE
jgi:hypothetical protein